MVDEKPDYRRNVHPFELHVNKQTSEAAAGGSGGGGMEPRVARLEADMDHIKRRVDEASVRLTSMNDKISSLQTEIAVIKEKLIHLPSKTYSIVTAVAIIAALGTLFVFLDRLRVLFGLV